MGNALSDPVATQLISEGAAYITNIPDPNAGGGGSLDPDLTAIGNLSGTGYLNRTGVNTWALDASPAGTNGARVARLTLYQWASSVPTTFPSGTSTFTWATGAYTAPGTLNGWSLTPGTPTAGQTLYEVYAYFSDSLTTATSVVTWSSTTAIATGRAGADGNPGTNGTRTAELELYIWSATSPTTFPSGTSTYTWATGLFTAPGTLNGWSLTPPAAVPGQTLWGIKQIFADTLTSTTSVVTWSSTSPYAIGAAGTNGASDWASITGKPTTRTGYGLTDVPTTTEVDDAITLALTNSGMQLIPITSAALATLRTSIIGNPLLAPPVGTPYLLTTGIFINRVVRWNGFSFKPDDGLSQYAPVGSFLGVERISNNTAADTTAGEMHRVTLPGWLMGPHTLIRVIAMFNHDNANTNTRIISAKLGTNADGHTTIGAVPNLSGANLGYSLKAEVANAGNLTNQVSVGNQTYGTAAVVQNLTKNTAVDFDIRFDGQWTTQQTPAVSIISLRGFSLEFIG